MLILLFVLGLALRGTGYLGSPFLTTVIVLIGVAGSVGALCSAVITYRVDPAERRAGYTTKKGDHLNLSQVDPRTNRVVRRAGEPFLEPGEYRRRLDLVRESDARENLQSRAGSLTAPAPGHEGEEPFVVTDAHGDALVDGGAVVITRDIRFRNSPAILKKGTVVGGIRLARDRTDDRVVGVRVDGQGWVYLRSGSVKKHT
ncbi:PhnA domain-containing protein [Promicromonospora thailandica]